MYLSKEQASEKWCPFARLAMQDCSTYNRDVEGKIAKSFCIADECMMWRIQKNTTEMDGYCGLAGKPTD